MRICILSNSHAASLQDKLATVGTETGNDFTVFAAPSTGMRHLVLNENATRLETKKAGIRKMLATTSGGSEHIEMSDFDAFLLHGLNVVPPRFDQRHSSGFRKAATSDMLEASLGYHFAKVLKSATTAPVVISPEPLPADMEEDETQGVRRSAMTWAEPISPEEIWATLAACSDLDDVHWLWQDPETIGTRQNTKRRYSTDSKRLAADDEIAHKDRDTRHMNSEYGEVVLRRAVAKFQSLT